MNTLEKRIIDISYKKGLSHIGSCLTALPIIDAIFSLKQPHEKFVLSQGHAGLALYVVLEKYIEDSDSTGLVRYKLNAEDIYDHHGTHPDRCEKCHLDCSTGSLGQGLPIALGMALANRGRNVYCLISDGECSEGSIWEALAIKQKFNVYNLKVYVNVNGYSAYDKVDKDLLVKKLVSFGVENIIETNLTIPCLQGLDGHYKILTEEEYKSIIEEVEK